MDLTNLPLWANIAIVFGIIFALLSTGMEIAFVLGTTGLLILIFLGGGAQGAISPILFTSMNSYVLAAVPLYIFMGEIMIKSGISDNLYRGVSRWTGPLPGGLVHSNIVACSLFAAVSGSSIATAATLGSVALKEQEERGYNRRLVMGSLAGGGTLGILIPPSIIMVIYGAFEGVSVARLFVGGVIPGLILAFLFMTWIGFASVIRPHWVPRPEKFTPRYFLNAVIAIKEIWPIVVLIAIIMGGIYLGVMTPTEAAGVAAFVALVFMALFRKLTFRLLSEALTATVRTSCMVLFIVIGARILAISMALIKLPAHLCALMLGSGLSDYSVWFFVVIMYLFLGCFMDGISLILLTLPVVFPLLVTGLGFDPIWFGVLLTILVECCLITPPVGINIYVIHGIAGGKNIQDVIIGIIPFFIILVLSIILFTAVPWLVTWLPATMF